MASQTGEDNSENGFQKCCEWYFGAEEAKSLTSVNWPVLSDKSPEIYTGINIRSTLSLKLSNNLRRVKDF